MKPEEKLKSPSKLRLDEPAKNLRLDPPDPHSVTAGADRLTPAASTAALGGVSGVSNYETYIKSQLLSKFYLHQYVKNNLQPQTSAPPVPDDSLIEIHDNEDDSLNPAGPLDLSASAKSRPHQLSPSNGGDTQTPFAHQQQQPVNHPAKYQVSALLLQAHRTSNTTDPIIIGGTGQTANKTDYLHDQLGGGGSSGKGNTAVRPFACTICPQTFTVQDRYVHHYHLPDIVPVSYQKEASHLIKYGNI